MRGVRRDGRRAVWRRVGAHAEDCCALSAGEKTRLSIVSHTHEEPPPLEGFAGAIVESRVLCPAHLPILERGPRGGRTYYSYIVHDRTAVAGSVI